MALIDCELHEIPKIQARINQLMRAKEEMVGDKPQYKPRKLG